MNELGIAGDGRGMGQYWEGISPHEGSLSNLVRNIQDRQKLGCREKLPKVTTMLPGQHRGAAADSYSYHSPRSQIFEIGSLVMVFL